MINQVTKMLTLVAVIGGFVGTSTLQATSSKKVTFYPMGLGGDGCPKSSSVVFDKKEGTFTFKDMLLKKDYELQFDRMACSIAIPFSVPKGYKMVIENQLVEGMATVPNGKSATLTTEVFFAGVSVDKFEESLKSTDGMIESYSLEYANSLSSSCGEAGNLRVNLSLYTSNSSVIKVEKMKLNIKVVPCL